MQTFLPYPDFSKSLACLDMRRLGKQRIEAKQIADAILPENSSGWRHHPIVKMWKGYRVSLLYYMNLAIYEWIRRGYKNTMEIVDVGIVSEFPSWLGNEDFHASHRSNLLRKDPIFYGRYGWTEPNNLPYVWIEC